MAYRLLALDIDGTLLKSNNRLDRETKEAIHYAQEKGVVVTLVTERHFYSAAKVAKALKLKHPIITHNGAFVSATIDAPIYTSKIEHAVLLQLVEFLETYQCQIRFSHEKMSVANRPRQQNLLAKMTIGVSEPLFYPVTYVQRLSDYLRENDDEATDVLVTLQPEHAEEIYESLVDYFPSVQIEKKSEDQIVLTKKGTSKFDGLEFLAARLDIPLSKIVAVGDSLADLEMIEKCGLGVAMKNAPKKVRDAAQWVTRSNDMNGVAYMVKEVFRKQMKLSIFN
ncbi:Cof-type HAD-IIB family hydrolase [Tuberibacillus calidus]|uniref:Cof-type HAD-IIB family hydrolase n=1 Tax=Tuberibacillus calidus TaxID=340097 RepID=UPI0004007FF3|nr:Cof-type HAD-IIB family hydrolase [Tuberibacillus calidus]